MQKNNGQLTIAEKFKIYEAGTTLARTYSDGSCAEARALITINFPTNAKDHVLGGR